MYLRLHLFNPAAGAPPRETPTAAFTVAVPRALSRPSAGSSKDETDYGRLDREIILSVFQTVMIDTCGATTAVALRLALRLARLVCLKYGVHADDDGAFSNACERLKFDLPLTP